MATLNDLASYASGKIPGIDWKALDAQGRGGVWNRDYILQYMIPAYQSAAAVRDTLQLDFDFSSDGALSAFKEAATNVTSVSKAVSDAVDVGLAMIDGGMKIDLMVYRYIIASVWQAAILGANLHVGEVIHHSGMSDTDIADHATLVTGMFQALTMMGNMPGVLDPLKLPAGAVPEVATEVSTSGLGIAPAVLVAIVIFAVLAIAIIAWMLISLKDVSDKNRIIMDVCTKAQQTGDQATISQCMTVASTANNNPLGSLPYDFMSTVLKYAAIGLGIYALIAFGPQIAESFMKTRKVIREAR